MKRKTVLLIKIVLCILISGCDFYLKIPSESYHRKLYWISPNEFIFESFQHRESQLWSMNIDAKTPRQLTTMGASIFTHFRDVISPNKQRILFWSNDDSVWELDIVSGKERCILFRKPNEEIAEMCQYSGNGKELFFVLKNKIYKINIATGEKHLIVKDGRVIDLNAKTMQAIIEKDSKIYFVDLNKPDNPKFLPTEGGSLSPNGDKIIFSKIDNDGSEELWIMNINTLRKIQIPQGSRKNYYRKTHLLSWSPDGSKIIYSFKLINNEYFGKVTKEVVCIVELKENKISVIRRIRNCKDFWISWLPDSKKIAFFGEKTIRIMEVR